MPINPNIAMSFRPVEIQQSDPLRDYATVAQIQNAQIQNQLARQQMEQEQGVTNYLRGGANLSTPEGRAGLRQFGKTGLGYEKLLAEQETNALKRQELEGKIREQRMTALGTGLTAVMQDPSDANLASAFDRLDATGVDTKPYRQSLLSEPDLAKRRSIITQYVTTNPEGRQALAFVQPKPLQVTRADKSIVFLDQNPNSPTYGQEVMPPQATGMSPYETGRLALEGKRVGLEGTRVGLESERVRLAQDEARLKREGIEGIAPKELQKREAALPAATAAMKGFESKSDSFVKDLIQLRDHPGLSEITGLVAGRLPALSAQGRAAQALYDKVVAKGGFQALQDLRDASKTGGALGNVSNQEGKQLTASFSAIDRRQDAPDVKAALDRAIGDVEGAKTRMREAYDATYAYRSARQPAESAAPATGGAKLDQERANAKAAIAAGASEAAVRARFKQNTGQEL